VAELYPHSTIINLVRWSQLMAQNDVIFSGSMPEFYDRHLGALFFQPYADDLADRLSNLTASTLLETAAGTGIVTKTLARRLPLSVQIVATDLNQPMLDYAKTKPGVGRVTFQQADALALPFPDDGFDVVVCQFGVMFFPDRQQGFREARRVLKPGGRLLFNVWDRIDRIPPSHAVVAGLQRRYPAHPSWFLERTTSGYHDPDIIRADLRAAGFADCRIDTVVRTGHAVSPRGVALGLCQGSPLRAEIEALDPTGLEAATDAAAAMVAERCGEGAFETPLQALVVETTR
jgi:ubiquinone/menaquinone biosynthesis C-methylase UbiE